MLSKPWKAGGTSRPPGTKAVRKPPPSGGGPLGRAHTAAGYITTSNALVSPSQITTALDIRHYNRLFKEVNMP